LGLADQHEAADQQREHQRGEERLHRALQREPRGAHGRPRAARQHAFAAQEPFQILGELLSAGE